MTYWNEKVNVETVCPLCERPIPGGCATNHHLVPKLKGGAKGPQELMHRICHSKIHSIFTESELAKEYNTVDKLLENEDIQKFVRWIQKKPDNYNDSNKLMKRL